MGTRYERRKDGKINKPPYRVAEDRPIIKADKTNPANWATFEVALAARERGEVDAIGFVFTEEDPFFVVDCDGIVDPETGELHPAANRIIHALDSYTEVSCSGSGTHTIGAGVKPIAKCKSEAFGFELEVYDRVRFVVLTGRQHGTTAGIEDCQQELDELCRKLWPAKERRHRRLVRADGVSLDDAELLDLARRSKTGARFRALYDRGDTGSYASHSEADYALINALIFWTAGDRERTVDLFCSSALYRDSTAGKHRSYVATSVDRALASYSGSYYRPRRTSAKERGPLGPYLRLLLEPSVWRGRRGASAYKAFTALVAHAAERAAVVDEEGNLRVRVDTRTLAETAGMSRTTLLNSALPYLLQELKVLRSWPPPSGEKTGGYVLRAANVAGLLSCTNRLYTLPIGTGGQRPDEALETLKLLIRMRSGKSKSAPLARLGMVAMFCAVAMCTAPPRGYTAEELAVRTGRPAYALLRRDGPLQRLYVAGVAEEAGGRYRLTPDFRAEWERELRDSGITRAERQQRWWHSEDRRKRAKQDPKAAKRAKESVARSHQKRAEELNRHAQPISELRRVPDHAPPELVAVLGEYIRRNPHRRDERPSWFATALVAEGHLDTKPQYADVELALWELREGVADAGVGGGA